MNKKIIVRRSIYNAAQKLQETATDTGQTVLSLVEKRMDQCQDAKDRAGARFWRDVWLYLMSASYLDSETEIVEDRP